jgi:hypothetical protein
MASLKIRIRKGLLTCHLVSLESDLFLPGTIHSLSRQCLDIAQLRYKFLMLNIFEGENSPHLKLAKIITELVCKFWNFTNSESI